MGYRSEVAGVFVFTSKESRASAMAAFNLQNADLDYSESIVNSIAEAEVSGLPALYYQIDGVKWYPDYGDVRAYESLKGITETCGGAWVFCRIGEDYDDVEYSNFESGEFDDHIGQKQIFYSAYYILNVSRAIQIEFN